MPQLPRRPLRPMLLCALIAWIPAWAASPHLPSNEDLRHLRTIDDPRLSPDGREVLIKVTDATADGGRSHLWLVDVPSNSVRQLTYSPGSDKEGESEGEWTPDGESVLFLAHRSDHAELFRLPMNGGEAKPFDLKIIPVVDRSKLPGALPPTDAPSKDQTSGKGGSKDEGKSAEVALDVKSFKISPSGKLIAFLAADPQTLGEKKQSEAKADANWVDHEIHLTRLYLLDPETSKLSPVSIALDVHGFNWSSDGTRLIVVAEKPNSDSDLGPARSAWLVDSAAPTLPTQIAALPATIDTSVFSGDGNSLFYLAQSEADAPPGYRDLFLYDLNTESTRNLSSGFSGSIGFEDPVPLPDGAMLQSIGIGVDASFARFASPQSAPGALKFPVAVASDLRTNVKRSGWVFLGSSGGQPRTLYYTAALDSPARKLATPPLVPADLLSVAPKRIHWRSDNLTIDGLLYLPPEEKTQHAPLIVEVHGGPLGAYQDSYQPFVDFLLGQGWAVLRTNPRGSTNYGAAFAAANKNDLGGGDYRDIMAGVDYVLRTEPVDSTRLGLIGYSYGGEMAGFVEGKTDRFKAIVSGAPVIDQFSEYGTEEDSWYDRWYFGKPWERFSDAWRQSPLSGAAKAKTPFLLLQGEADTTDPLGQSQEMYRALRQSDVPVELVTYPRENHEPLALGIFGYPVREPWHGFDARQRIIMFFTKAFGPAAR